MFGLAMFVIATIMAIFLQFFPFLIAGYAGVGVIVFVVLGGLRLGYVHRLSKADPPECCPGICADTSMGVVRLFCCSNYIDEHLSDCKSCFWGKVDPESKIRNNFDREQEEKCEKALVRVPRIDQWMLLLPPARRPGNRA